VLFQRLGSLAMCICSLDGFGMHKYDKRACLELRGGAAVLTLGPRHSNVIGGEER